MTKRCDIFKSEIMTAIPNSSVGAKIFMSHCEVYSPLGNPKCDCPEQNLHKSDRMGLKCQRRGGCGFRNILTVSELLLAG